MNASRSLLSFVVAAFLLAACSTSTSGTSTGLGNGTGATGASGGSGGSPSGGSPTGGSATAGGPGGSTTGPVAEDPIGTTCAKTGNGDYVSCSTSLDCQCPLLCGLDPTLGADDAGGSICVFKCTQDSECPDIFTHCDSHGLCTTNICEADGGSDGTAFMGACNASGTNDGTCEPGVASPADIIGICYQAGTAAPGGACDTNYLPFSGPPTITIAGNAKRPSGASLCPIGYECNAAGTCQQLCDPVFNAQSDNDAGGCETGNCVVLGKNTAFGGACQEQGDGGCLVGQGNGELADCTLSTDCECPLSCKVDIGDSFLHLCEKECTDTVTDCDFPYTTCQKLVGAGQQHYCNLNFCAQTYFGIPFKPDGGPGFGQSCNYATLGDGNCQLEFVVVQGQVINSYGLCFPGGNIPTGGSCDGASANDCIAGDLCAPLNTGATCEPVCDPRSDGGCPAGDGCFSWIPSNLPQITGVCLNPCSSAAANCVNSSECCDGFCDFDADAGVGTCN